MKNAQNSAPVPPAQEKGDTPATNAANGERFLRIKDLVKPHGILPVCRSTFLNWIREGRMSPGILLGPRTRVWKRSEIMGLLDRPEAQGGQNG